MYVCEKERKKERKKERERERERHMPRGIDLEVITWDHSEYNGEYGVHYNHAWNIM